MHGSPRTAERKAVRLAFMNGEGSIRELALRFNLPRRTIENWCADEQWHVYREKVGGEIVANAVWHAGEESKAIAMNAVQLVARTLATSEKFFHRVDSMLEKGDQLSSGELRQAAATWEIAVDTARKALGMDIVHQSVIENRITVVNCLTDQMRALADELESRKTIVDVDSRCESPYDSTGEKGKLS